jgi:pimeloyl-ACP methyl ester carboxylesterase
VATADVNGIKLFYEDIGSGDRTLLLVHGFPLGWRLWEGQIDALKDRYRIIAPDLRGYGGSDAPEDIDSYSLELYADDLAALLDGLGIAKVVYVGLSMGGYMAFPFLRKYGDKVEALVLADTRAEGDPPEGVEKRSAQQAQIRDEGIEGLVAALPKALLSKTTWDQKPDVVERAKALMQHPDAGWLGSLQAMKTRPDSSDQLTSINVPTLIIVGEEDGITPPEAARKMHEHIGGSRLVVLPGAGHLSNLETPEAFNGALADFLGDL